MPTKQEFIETVKQGNRPAVERALDADPTLTSETEDGVSAVLLAIYHGHEPIARVVANAKGELDVFEAAALGDQHAMGRIIAQNPGAVNEYGADGFTPLGLAAFFGHLEMVKLLLQHGANPNLQTNNPLGVIPLHSALANGHKEIARVLVEAKSDVNFPTREGWVPLHYTARNGDWETSDFLLMHGASTSQKNNIGETPAMEARKFGYDHLADILE